MSRLTKRCAYKRCRAPIPQRKAAPGLSTSRIDGTTRICSDCGTGEAMSMRALPEQFDLNFQLPSHSTKKVPR